VTLSYRNEVFNRLKPANNLSLNEALAAGKIDLRLNTNLVSVEKDYVIMALGSAGENIKIKNDLVYIFAGGELPTQFLEKAGIKITRKFGETVMKH